MTRLLFGILLLTILGSGAYGQQPMDPTRAAVSPSDVAGAKTPQQGQVSPEMWYYMQERNRLEDPKLAVRRNAEFRGAQRRRRIESSRWFGYSRLRPQASPAPFMGTYAPAWVGNSGWNDYRWIGHGGYTNTNLFLHPSAIWR